MKEHPRNERTSGLDIGILLVMPLSIAVLSLLIAFVATGG